MLKYEVALTNVFWDINDINTRHFENLNEQSTYFDELTRGLFSPLVNFNMGDNIETAIIYRDESGRDISELVKCNYLVLRKYEDDEIVERRYYFANVEQDSGTQLRVTITLDDIQTNYIKYRDEISPCNIIRTHLDRFKNIDNDIVSFNLTEGSPLFDSEGDNYPKRLIKRSKLNFKYTGDDIFNNWLNDNIKYWVYVFCDQYHQYNVVNPNNGNNVTTPSTALALNTQGKTDIACICYPVYKNDIGTSNIIIVKNSNSSESREFYLNDIGYRYFRTENENSSYLYNVKISLMSPFNTTPEYTINSNNSLVINSATWYTSDFDLSVANLKFIETSEANKVGVFSGIDSKELFKIESEEYETNKLFTFNKSELKGLKNIKFEPKLLSQNYSELHIKSSDGESFIYDNQKIGDNKINILYSESIQPEVTKYYARIKGPKGLYIKETDENYTGLVGSTDNSLNVANDQYSNFIANNKNYFLQSNLKLIEGVGHSIISSGISGANGNVPSAITAGIGGITSTISQLVQRNLTIDNMKASPGSIRNAGGNILFNLSVNELGIYIEEFEALEEDKIKMYDYLFSNGYSFNHIGNLSLFDNTRKYFNYIEAEVGTINAPISNKEKQRLRDRLRSVRFWHTDTIDYSLENYERWL